MAYYNTRDSGYNQTDGGYQSIRHVKLTKATLELVIADLKLCKTNIEIATKFNISACMVQKINSGRA